MAIPFAAIPLLDHHCHSLLRRQPEDVAAFRACFTESDAAEIIKAHLPSSIFYGRALRDLAEFFGCAADEGAVLAARDRMPFERRVATAFQEAHIRGALVDGGFLRRDQYSTQELAHLLPCRVAPVVRLEALAEDLLPASTGWPDLVERFSASVEDAIASGAVALKTIIAYRSGLRVERWDEAAVQGAFLESRAAGTPVRLTAKPLLDALLLTALRIAARRGVPVQIHTGFGDRDLDLLLANPLWLRPVLEDATLRAAPLILLHCHPYVKEAAWLASVYPRVYVDLSLAAPHLAHGAAQAIADALAMAPATKVLLATDASRIPELFWVAARHLRRSLGAALSAVAAQDYVDARQADSIAVAVLWDNASRLYGLGWTA
jgi:predicted TIM-barrel fold metal-dependent hydrolase